jgi:RNA polymerase sigma-70 factor (ECF subfamily)
MGELPDAQREAIELHHLHGLTLAQTADEMGRTAPSVMGLLRRGLLGLQALLDEDDGQQS